MLTKENEAARFNDGKIQFSLVSFNMFGDMFKYFSYIENFDTKEVCMKEMIKTLSTITDTENKTTYEVMLPLLQALGYKLALLYKKLNFYNSKLYDLRAFEDMTKVLEYGIEKYDRNNWRKGYINKFSTADSLYRHLRQLIIGESYDEESGLHHIGHIMCNVMFLTNDLLFVDRK